MNQIEKIIEEIQKLIDIYHPDDLYEVGYDSGLKRAIDIIKKYNENKSYPDDVYLQSRCRGDKL